MISLFKILNEISQKTIDLNLNEIESILYEDAEFFLEFCYPDMAYEYHEVEKNIWEFEDRFHNKLGIRIDPSTKYVESYFIMKYKNSDKFVRVYDILKNQDVLDMTTFQGGSDEHRSDTICKIIRDEIIPKYLSNHQTFIKIHPIDQYRRKIFEKCIEVCIEKYPNLKRKDIGNEILLINQ